MISDFFAPQKQKIADLIKLITESKDYDGNFGKVLFEVIAAG